MYYGHNRTTTRPVNVGSRGFTLIELLIVIAIIAILAAILFPVFAKARDKARQAACSSNMKQIALATAQYLQDFDGVFPTQEGSSMYNYMTNAGFSGGSPNVPLNYDLFNQLQPYVKTTQIFACPSAPPFVDKTGCGVTCLAPTGTNQASYVTNGVVLHIYDGTNNFNRGLQEQQIPNPSEIIYVQEFGFTTNSCIQRPRWNPSTGSPANSYNYWHGTNSYSTATCNDTQCLSGLHNYGGNVIYCDAHVKFRPYASLHAGEFGLSPDDPFLETNVGTYRNPGTSGGYSALF